MASIPDEAVEAAAEVLRAADKNNLLARDHESPRVHYLRKTIMRRALEAAAPHLMRAALRAVADDLDAGIVYGWDSDRQYADYLRSRATESEADRG